MGKPRRKEKSFGAKPTLLQRVKKLNPYDLVFHKSKANIELEQKLKPKHSSKRRAYEVRKRTIGVEYLNEGKKNKIVDRRLAENDLNISASEKAERRFILQRKSLFSYKRKSMFNLENEEDSNGKDVNGLFTENVKFNLRKKIEKDDEGELDANLVALANFGGGTFDEIKRKENLALSSESLKRSDILANIISMSKQTKALRQKERDLQADNTDRLNELFSKLKNAGAIQLTKDCLNQPTNKLVNADSKQTYDVLYKELQFDNGKKALPTAAREIVEVGTPEKFTALLTEFEKLSAVCTIENIEKMDDLLQKIYKSVKVHSSSCSLKILEILKAKRSAILVETKTNPNYGGVSFSVVGFIQMIGNVFSTSERFHLVCTPICIFALETIANARVRNIRHLAQILFLCRVMADWVSVSKRYLPEVLAFLHGALLLCTKSLVSEAFPSLSFPITMPFRQMLYVQQCSNELTTKKLSVTDVFKNSNFGKVETDGDVDANDIEHNCLRLPVIHVLISTVCTFVELYKCHTISFYAIFKPFLSLLNRLPIDNYSTDIRDNVENLANLIRKQIDSAPQLSHLKVLVPPKTDLIKFLEPKFDINFDTKQSFGKRREKTVRTMRQKLRKETRGAMKELRNDARFIGRLQTERFQKISSERRQKTKRILAGLQMQESEYKKRKAKKF